MARVTPHIVVRDAGRAAEWYGTRSARKLRGGLELPDGRFLQIELVFGDSGVMIADEFPESGAVSPQTLGGTFGALTTPSTTPTRRGRGRSQRGRRPEEVQRRATALFGAGER